MKKEKIGNAIVKKVIKIIKKGKEQSPINLPSQEKAVHSKLRPLFNYKEVSAQIVLNKQTGDVKAHENMKIKIEDGALKIKHEDFGEIVTLDGSVYKAQEIVFHTPAEHTINGKKYDMEMQVVHYGQTKGDIAKQIVLSFLFENSPGTYNKFIDDVDFFNLPNQINRERDLVNNLFIPKIFYNSESEDLPVMKPFSFYTYQGSLTAPPCTERTIVYVASTPIPISTTAIHMFEEALRVPDMMTTKGDVIVSNTLPYNSRATQKKNGRIVYYFDANENCDAVPPPKKRKGPGHYERIDRDVAQYYYISGSEPSGMPGAILVSAAEANGKTNVLNLAS